MSEQKLRETIRKIIKESKQFLDYVDEFQKFAEKKLKGKNFIGKWKLTVDHMSGTFEFNHTKIKKFVVLATPFWDGNQDIPFNAMTDDPLDKLDALLGAVPFKPTYNLNKDLSVYLSKLKSGLNKAEKLYLQGDY